MAEEPKARLDSILRSYLGRVEELRIVFKTKMRNIFEDSRRIKLKQIKNKIDSTT